MAKKIKQFRYYNDGVENVTNNAPSLVNGQQTIHTHFQDGSVFAGYYPIVQLGIQTIPGTKFFLNDSLDPIIVDSTGIYELNLNSATEIQDLKFDAKSLRFINDNDSAYLIVDIIYDDGEGL